MANYYGKFKPTKGAFGNKSKFQKSLERQQELRKQIAEFEARQAETAKQETPKAKKTSTKKAEKKQENATTATK